MLTSQLSGKMGSSSLFVELMLLLPPSLLYDYLSLFSPLEVGTFFLQVSSRFMFWSCLGQTLACLNCHSSFRGGLLSWDIVFVINQYKKEGKLFSNSISLVLRRYENINSISLNLNYTLFITLFCVDIFYLFTNWF